MRKPRQAKTKLLFRYPLSLSSEERVERERQFFSSYTTISHWLIEVWDHELHKRSSSIQKQRRELRRKDLAIAAAIEVIRQMVVELDGEEFDPKTTRRRLLETGLNEEELRTLFDKLANPLATIVVVIRSCGVSNRRGFSVRSWRAWTAKACPARRLPLRKRLCKIRCG
jgi:hypothetical protein